MQLHCIDHRGLKRGQASFAGIRFVTMSDGNFCQPQLSFSLFFQVINFKKLKCPNPIDLRIVAVFSCRLSA